MLTPCLHFPLGFTSAVLIHGLTGLSYTVLGCEVHHLTAVIGTLQQIQHDVAHVLVVVLFLHALGKSLVNVEYGLAERLGT